MTQWTTTDLVGLISKKHKETNEDIKELQKKIDELTEIIRDLKLAMILKKDK
jgi:peptidoglycan hydrolase CwlO-like protein